MRYVIYVQFVNESECFVIMLDALNRKNSHSQNAADHMFGSKTRTSQELILSPHEASAFGYDSVIRSPIQFGLLSVNMHQ